MTLLTIAGLTVSAHAHPLLRGVSLDIAAGETVALTGESGSGKSMTALAVMGLLPQTVTAQGQIILDGTVLSDLTEAQMCARRGRDIGMVFQEPMTALNPVQTIGDQVAELFRLHDGQDRVTARRRATEVLARVGLPADRFPPTRYPHELSGGQRQRVVIAMAIALRPRLLIADEPTTALDVTTQAQILALLQDLVRDYGMGLMMITHDLAVVAQMAQRIVVMRHGAVVETGTTRQILTAPEQDYTRQLLAASAHQVTLPRAPIPDPAEPPLLSVTGAVRDYALPRPGLFARPGRFRAVDNVSFALNRGERLGLVGESGCGKSTLTRAILGLDPLQAGQIALAGQPILAGARADRAQRRRLQVVFQDPFGSFNPRHRVGRLICEPLHLLDQPPSGPARHALVAETLRAVGLEPADAARFIHQFSGGQRQRIAIARALIIRPDLILLDEAVSALDVSVRAQILDLLAGLCASHGLSYLFISHDLGVVRSVTDRVLVMQSGRIVESGPTARVFDAPTHPYTKALLAAAPRLPAPLLPPRERTAP